MADIAPELYEKIKEAFQKRYDQGTLFGKPLSEIESALRARTATFRDADAYAVEVGSMLSDAMKEVLKLEELPGKRLAYDIAKRTIGTSLQDSYRMVSNVASVVQEEINGRAEIGLKPVKPEMTMADIDKICEEAAKAREQKQLDTALTEPVKTYPRKVVDDTVRVNARAHNRAGLDVRVTRIYDGVGVHRRKDPCEWCLSRCGKDMTYADAMAKGAFQRHPGCGCEIIYMVGKSVQRQTDWTTNEWTDVEEHDIIKLEENMQKTPGERIIDSAILSQQTTRTSDTLVDAIIEYHESLKHYTPEDMKKKLEEAGYEVKPLGNRSQHFPGIPFEQGGGYRVHFGGDGYLQYHPQDGRHKIAYWKVSNGKRKIHKYDLEGNEVFF